jgi:hypothetical protein
MDAQPKAMLRTHTEYGQRFHPPLHTSYTAGVYQPHYVEMSSQGIMTSRKTHNDPGLHPVKGHSTGLGAQTGSQD